MKRSILLSLLLLTAVHNSQAGLYRFKVYSRLSAKEQARVKPLDFNAPDSTPAVPTQWTDIKLKSIDEEQLKNMMRNSGARLNYVVIFSSGCGGTPYIINYIKSIQQRYTNDVAVYFLCSQDYAASDEIKQVLFKLGWFKQAYIIDNKYGEFRKDDREKGKKFSEILCEDAKKDVIGVPYNLVFDSNLNVLFHGYQYYKNPLPADIIKYFMEKDS